MDLTSNRSVAESTASQLDTKLKANQIKLKLKQLLKNVDQDKQGRIKESVFVTICQLLGVNLSQKDQAQLGKRFGSGGSIKYKEALGELQIDMLAAVDNEIRWIVQRPQEKAADAPSVTAKKLQKLDDVSIKSRAKSIAASSNS